MGLSERQIGLLQECLEVLFRTLLSMKTDGVKIRRLPHPDFPVCRRKIPLSFFDPFTG